MKNIIRHGDLLLKKISKLPSELKEENTKILITSSGGNDHFIDKGKVYFKQVDNFVFGYLVAKNTTLNHIEHGKIKLNGIYELRKQQEITHEGMKPVVD